MLLYNRPALFLQPPPSQSTAPPPPPLPASAISFPVCIFSDLRTLGTGLALLVRGGKTQERTSCRHHGYTRCTAASFNPCSVHPTQGLLWRRSERALYQLQPLSARRPRRPPLRRRQPLGPPLPCRRRQPLPHLLLDIPFVRVSCRLIRCCRKRTFRENL